MEKRLDLRWSETELYLIFEKFIVYINHNGYNKYCQVSKMKQT